jgi:hypothetical protein
MLWAFRVAALLRSSTFIDRCVRQCLIGRLQRTKGSNVNRITYLAKTRSFFAFERSWRIFLDVFTRVSQQSGCKCSTLSISHTYFLGTTWLGTCPVQLFTLTIVRIYGYFLLGSSSCLSKVQILHNLSLLWLLLNWALHLQVLQLLFKTHVRILLFFE